MRPFIPILFIVFYVTGLALLGETPMSILRDNRFFHTERARQKRKAEARWIRKGSRVHRYMLRLSAVLKDCSVEAGVESVIRMKILLAILGFLIGILMQNVMLACVLTIGFFWVPTVYFKVAGVKYNKAVDDAIETAMGIVTNSYLQGEDLKSAVLENIGRIEQPLKFTFREFLAETGFVDANIVHAIERMKAKVDNVYFGDWCDILMQCQDDRELKYVLPSIVTKLNSVKRIQIELDGMMLEIYKEFIYVVGIVVLNIPLMLLINAEWADILLNTTIGKITVALCTAILFLSSAYVVSVNKSLVRT